MGNRYKPVYYSTMQDSITSICKSILPFSLKKRRLTTAEENVPKQQEENLKWQQTCFHQILNLMGLHKEGLVSSAELAAFRGNLLDTLIASNGPALEHPPILRDTLLFLQELLHEKCISDEEYHASKRPLIQRLAVRGVELEARDVIPGVPKENSAEQQEEWSTIDLRDDKSLINKGNSSSKQKFKNGTSSALKHIKETATVFGLLGKNRQRKSIFDKSENGENPVSDKQENIQKSAEKSKKRNQKSASMQWGFDGFKRWKRTNLEDDTTPLHLCEISSDSDATLVTESPDARQIKPIIVSDTLSTGFIIDKVLGDKIKMELLRIQTELSSTNPDFNFSDDQMNAISIKLPVVKSDLLQFFRKSWCEQYGDVVLDVVKKEIKNHVGENENMQNATSERRQSSSKRWTTFDDDENCHPNRIQVSAPIRIHSTEWTTFDDDENCHPNRIQVSAPIRIHSTEWTTFDDDEHCHPNRIQVSAPIRIHSTEWTTFDENCHPNLFADNNKNSGFCPFQNQFY